MWISGPQLIILHLRHSIQCPGATSRYVIAWARYSLTRGLTRSMLHLAIDFFWPVFSSCRDISSPDPLRSLWSNDQNLVAKSVSLGFKGGEIGSSANSWVPQGAGQRLDSPPPSFQSHDKALVWNSQNTFRPTWHSTLHVAKILNVKLFTLNTLVFKSPKQHFWRNTG